MGAAKGKKKLSKETKRTLVAYSFIAPNFIGFAVFTLIPVVFAFILAFTEWDGSNPIQWVGFGNFIELFHDTFFKAALKNTIIYCIGTVPLTMMSLSRACDCIKSKGGLQGSVPYDFLLPLCSFPSSCNSCMENAVF